MGVPVGVFLAINAGGDSVDGWGVALSTDTAFAIGILALVGSRLSARLRVSAHGAVVDDLVALGVIAIAYSGSHLRQPLGSPLGLRCSWLVRARGSTSAWSTWRSAVGWMAVRESGVDPVVVGLLWAADRRARLRGSTWRGRPTRFRHFREQPTAQLARNARAASTRRCHRTSGCSRFHPWSCVRDRAAVRAGERGRPRSSGGFLGDAFRSP